MKPWADAMTAKITAFLPTVCFRTFIVLAAVAAAIDSNAASSQPPGNPAPPADIQVLLIGDDPSLLTAALDSVGGELTHKLPIIRGIGGNIPTAALSTVQTAFGVARVIEDYNPPAPAPMRDCDIAGSLAVDIANKALAWPLFNFSDAARPISELQLRWPITLSAPVAITLGTIGLSVQEALAATGNQLVIQTSLPALPTGRTLLRIQFDDELDQTTQNDFAIALTAGCRAELARAYPNNSDDYYYNRVIGADLLHAQDITGRGVTIAVLDSGFWEHNALQRATDGKRRVLARYDAIADMTPAQMTDESGHGSHMSSIIGNSSATVITGKHTASVSYKGVAPDANLIPIKVVDARGNADYLDILRGLQWVLDNHKSYNIRVLNVSLAATPRFDYWDDPINQAVFKLWQAGITVIAAAGNDGPEYSTIGSPGNNPYVITVGAVTDSWTPMDRSDDYIPDFSSRGPTAVGHIKPDIVAPGGHITGLVPPDSTLARESPDYVLPNGDFVSTGSSQAAALVSGIAALLLQVEPSLSNNDIKCMLTRTAEPAINPDGRLAYSPFVQGQGYASAARALTLGERGCGNEGLNIDDAVAGNEKIFGPTIALPDGSPSLPGLPHLLTETPTEKGLSDTRRWGVKAHIDRLDSADIAAPANIAAGWLDAYIRERDIMQALSEGADRTSTQATVPARNPEP